MLSIVDVHLALAVQRKSLAINLWVLSCCYTHQKSLTSTIGIYLEYKLEPSMSFEELHPGT